MTDSANETTPAATASHSRTVQNQYNRWAAIYDWLWSGYIDRTLSVLSESARLEPHHRVLDVGCGTGAFAERLVAEEQSFHELVGVDVSDQMLQAARNKHEHNPNVRFVQADAANLPFADAEFDVVVSSSTLHYFPEPAAALTEMARVAGPDGEVIILDWCRDFLSIQLLGVFIRQVDPAHNRSYTLEELQEMLRACGLRPRHSHRFRMDWFWGMMIVATTPDVH